MQRFLFDHFGVPLSSAAIAMNHGVYQRIITPYTNGRSYSSLLFSEQVTAGYPRLQLAVSFAGMSLVEGSLI